MFFSECPHVLVLYQNGANEIFGSQHRYRTMHLNIDVDHFQSTLVSHLSLVCPLALFMLVFWASRKTLNKKNLKKSGFLVPLRAKVLPSWKEDDMNFPGRKCNTLYGFISLFLTNYFSSYFCWYLWWQVSPMKVKEKKYLPLKAREDISL